MFREVKEHRDGEVDFGSADKVMEKRRLQDEQLQVTASVSAFVQYWKERDFLRRGCLHVLRITSYLSARLAGA